MKIKQSISYGLLFVSVFAGQLALADSGGLHKRYKSFYGVKSLPATGFNRFLGQPVMQLGRFGSLGFETVAAYNQGADTPTVLTRGSSKSTLLATYVDNEFMNSFINGASAADLPPDQVNIPLRDVKVNTGPTGKGFRVAPKITQAIKGVPFETGQSLPADPVTLRDWTEAQGRMSFECARDGTSIARMKLTGLLPRRLYTIWGFFEDKKSVLPLDDFGPIRPLGGVSNLVVADANGNGEYKRKLNFCPMKLKKDEVPLSMVFVYFHSDQATYGAVLSHTGEGRFPGATGHVAMQFPVSATGHKARRLQRPVRVTSDFKKPDDKPFTESEFRHDPYFKDKSAPARVIEGVVATGWNRDLNSDPVGIMPGEVGPFGFTTIGAYNTNVGGTSTRITHETPDRSILATFIDAETITTRFPLFQLEPILEQATNNVPYHMTPIADDATGLGRSALAGQLDVGQMDYSRAEPSGPITLGQLKQGQAIVKFSCPKNELPKMVMKFKNMLPNRFYNIFEWYQTGAPVGTFDIFPQYVGGLPDAFTTDEHGSGEYRARLNRCPPLTLDAEGIGLGWVVTARLNHETHAGTIVAPMHQRDVRMPGEIATAHIIFLLRGLPFNNN